jgi:hypothetical protein
MSSSSHKSEAWIERWWPAFVIVFGVLFVYIIDNFAPKT